MRSSGVAACFGAVLMGCNLILGHDPGIAARADAAAAASDAGPSTPLEDAAVVVPADASACNDPSCADPDVFPACGARACPTALLASDLRQAVTITADDTYVYWIDASKQRILQVPSKGGDIRVLARDQADAVALTSDGLNVYWTAGAEVRKVPRAGGAVSVVASTQVEPTFLTVDDATVYWVARASATDRVLRGRRKTANQGVPLDLEITVGTATGLTVDSSSAYFADPVMGTLERVALHPPCVPPSPCAAPPLARNQSLPQHPHVHSAYVYWTNSGNQRLMRAPADGLCNQPPCAEVLAQDQKNPTVVVADDAAVYWINAGTSPTYVDGAVQRRQLDTGRVTELASGQATPVSIALTQTEVVWLDRGTPPAFTDGALHRISKL